MIDSLELVDFQSHKESTLNFSPGYNVIIGPTNNGKSSIIRGLRMLLENKPSGNTFIRNGTKTLEVEGKFTDGASVRRVKGKKNLYIKDGGTDDPYEGFGQKVPDDLIKLFNTSEVNLQNQLDNFFLLEKRGSEVAKILNEIVDLTILDTSTDEVNSKARKAKADREVVKKSIVELNEKLDKKEFENIDNAIKEWNRIESIEKSIDGMKKEIVNIEMVKKQYQEFLSDYDGNDYNSIWKEMEEIFNLEGEIIGMEEAVESLEESVEDYKKILKKTEDMVDYIEAEKSHREILALDDSILSIADTVSSIRSKLSDYAEEQTRVFVHKEELEDLEREYEEVKPDVCPTCGGEWK